MAGDFAPARRLVAATRLEESVLKPLVALLRLSFSLLHPLPPPRRLFPRPRRLFLLCRCPCRGLPVSEEARPREDLSM